MTAAVLCALTWANAALADELVVIEGIEGDELANVRDFLGFGDEDCDSPAWRLRALLRDARDNARTALEVYGYYNPVISIRETEADGCWQARIDIEPGPPVVLDSVEVRVAGVPPGTAPWATLLEANPLKKGERFLHREYETYKQRFDALANRLGYFDARFSVREVRVDPDENTAEVRLRFRPGKRYTFGAVNFEQDVVEEELLARFPSFAPGDFYDSELIGQFYEALLSTGYFATLEIATDPQKKTNTVDVSVLATAALPTTLTTGIGFGTDTGPQVRLSYFDRRRNREGHQWEATFSVSTVVTEIGANYRIPLDKPPIEWLQYDIGYKDEDTDTTDSQLAKVGVKRLQQRRRGWVETQFLDVTNESFETADGRGRAFLITPGISWARVSLVDVARPRRGSRLSLQLSGASESLGSDLSFLRAVASGKRIWPLPFNMRLLTRLEVGATSVADFRELPASLRFFAGGDFSVRGYDFKSLGPEDANGRVIGGDNLLTGTVEVDVPVAKNWAVAAFVDAGNAFDDFSDINVQTSAGAGVRWYSPIGPVRLDVAHPLDDDTLVRIHVRIGPDL